MKLSVIVCTRNRSHAILGCLDSIAASLSKAAPLDAEIVVVDNGSEDNSVAMIRAWAGSCAFPVRLVMEPRKGVAKARNCAIRASQGDLLIFTDDDCRLGADHITDALRHDAADTGDVLRGGRVELGDPTDLPLTIKTDNAAMRWNLGMNSARHEWLGNCIPGCNMAMRRTIVERLGLFDERFGPGTAIPAGEDTDYIFRVYLAGITLEYVPDMTVFHHHGRKRIADGNKLLRNYLIGVGSLYAKYIFKYPNFCRPFYWDIKNSIREIAFNRNSFLPDIGFSHKHKVAYSMLGAAKYFAGLGRKAG